MGVSGSGKSSIGSALARSFGLDFIDGDNLHPVENIKKMSEGIPLTDTDRWPWLDACAQVVNQTHNTIVACSALKLTYRDRIRSTCPEVVFVHLEGPRDLLIERMSGRTHFMKPSMLDSQLETLEPLRSDEGFMVNIDQEKSEVIKSVSRGLGLYLDTQHLDTD